MEENDLYGNGQDDLYGDGSKPASSSHVKITKETSRDVTQFFQQLTPEAAVKILGPVILWNCHTSKEPYSNPRRIPSYLPSLLEDNKQDNPPNNNSSNTQSNFRPGGSNTQ